MPTGAELGAIAWEQWGSKGLPVFPCNNEKRPLCKWGKDASTEKEEILSLFARYGSRAQFIGGVMGEKAGLFALDFDTYKTPKAAQFKAVLSASGLLPDTRLHTTKSGGQHYIFFCPENMAIPRNSLPAKGVEVRGEGGYIILPPSKGYKVVSDKTAVAPEGLIKRLNKAREDFNKSSVAALKRKIIEGEVFHEAALLLAAKLSSAGRDPADVREALYSAFNASVASDPNHARHDRWKAIMEGKDNELGRVLGSAYTKYNPKKVDDNVASVAPIVKKRNRDVTGNLFSAKFDHDDDDPAPATSVDPDAFPFDKSYNAGSVDDQDDKGFLVYPLIMESDVLVLSAPPKAGKTLVAMTLALHMAAGLPLGDLTPVDDNGNVAQLPVIYFALEGQGAIRKRVKAWLTWQQSQGLNLSFDDIRLYVVEQSINLAKPEDQQEVVDKIVLANEWFKNKGWGPIGMVVFDTLTKAMPGKDQNSVEDTSSVFHTIDMMRGVNVDCAAMFIHHNNKQGKGPRGSSNIMAEPDTILSVDKVDPIVLDGTKYDCYGLEVFMARAVDDTQVYKMKAEAVEIGVNQQGIMQVAPVLDIVENYDTQPTAMEDTLKKKREKAKGEFYALLYQLMSQSEEMSMTIGKLHRRILNSGNELAASYYSSYINSSSKTSVIAGIQVLIDRHELPASLGGITFVLTGETVVMQLGFEEAGLA